jgi:hypothetical protein
MAGNISSGIADGSTIVDSEADGSFSGRTRGSSVNCVSSGDSTHVSAISSSRGASSSATVLTVLVVATVIALLTRLMAVE